MTGLPTRTIYSSSPVYTRSYVCPSGEDINRERGGGNDSPRPVLWPDYICSTISTFPLHPISFRPFLLATGGTREKKLFQRLERSYWSVLARKRTGDVELQVIPASHDGTVKYNGWGNSRSFFLLCWCTPYALQDGPSLVHFVGFIRLGQPSRRDCAGSHHSIRQVRGLEVEQWILQFAPRPHASAGTSSLQEEGLLSQRRC